jgi:hypothetical protein
MCHKPSQHTHYNVTPLLPLGCPVIIHNKPATCHTYDFRSTDGFYVGVSLEHHCCHCVIDSKKSPFASPTQSTSVTTISPSRPSHQRTPLSTALTPYPMPSLMLPPPPATHSYMQSPLSANSLVGGKNHTSQPRPLLQIARLSQLGKQTLHFSSFSSHQKDHIVNPPLPPSPGPLFLLLSNPPSIPSLQGYCVLPRKSTSTSPHL